MVSNSIALRAQPSGCHRRLRKLGLARAPSFILQAYQWMWREFLELEPALKSVLSERERAGAAFKVKKTLHFLVGGGGGRFSRSGLRALFQSSFERA